MPPTQHAAARVFPAPTPVVHARTRNPSRSIRPLHNHPSAQRVRHDMKISGKLYRFVPPFVVLYRLVPLISEIYFFAIHRRDPNPNRDLSQADFPTLFLLNGPKTACSRLFPPIPAFLKGGGETPKWLNLPISSPTKSSQVVPSRAKSRHGTGLNWLAVPDHGQPTTDPLEQTKSNQNRKFFACINAPIGYFPRFAAKNCGPNN